MISGAKLRIYFQLWCDYAVKSAKSGRNDERGKRKAMFTSALPCKEEEDQRSRCVILSPPPAIIMLNRLQTCHQNFLDVLLGQYPKPLSHFSTFAF